MIDMEQKRVGSYRPSSGGKAKRSKFAKMVLRFSGTDPDRGGDGIQDHRDTTISLIPNLRRFARAFTGNRVMCDDLINMALKRMRQDDPSCRDEAELKVLIFKNLHNVLAGARLAGSRSYGNSEKPAVESSRQRQELDAAHALRAQLDATLQAMPFEQRAAFLLVVLERLSYEQAARVMAVEVETIRQNLVDAREAMSQNSCARDVGQDGAVPNCDDRRGVSDAAFEKAAEGMPNSSA